MSRSSIARRCVTARLAPGHPPHRALWGESGSTPGRRRALRIVAGRNGRGSDGARRFGASSRALAMKALTLRPWAAALRRTCIPMRPSSDMVVPKMQRIMGCRLCIKPESTPDAEVGVRDCLRTSNGVSDDLRESRSACSCQSAKCQRTLRCGCRKAIAPPTPTRLGKALARHGDMALAHGGGPGV